MNISRLSYSFYFYLIIILFFSCSKEDVSEETVIATIGSHKITVHDFRISYELAPPGKKRQLEDINKKKLAYLNQMIEDKLFSIAGLEQEIHKNENVQRLLKWHEKEAVIKELYKDEVSNQVLVSENETQEAFILTNQRLFLRQFIFQAEDKAKQVYDLLNNGSTFEEIAMELAKSEKELEYLLTPKEFKWGELDENFEIMAYGLNHMEISVPYKTEVGYHLVQMVNRKQKLILTDSDYNARHHYIETIIRRRKEAKLAKQYVKSAMTEKHLKVNGPVLIKISNQAQSVLMIKKLETPIPAHAQSRVIRPHLAKLMNEDILVFEGGSWTVEDLFDKIENMPPYSRPDMTDPGKLQINIAVMFRDEYLTNEGYKRGLEKRESILQEASRIRDEVGAERMRRSLMDTINISDKEIRKYYSDNINHYTIPEVVRVKEIMVRDRELADSLLEAIQKGDKISDLATEFSIRKWAAKNGGDLGYFDKNAFGNIGRATFSMEIGEIKGPLPVKIDTFIVGYSIVELIDRKPAKTQNLGDIYNKVSDDLLEFKQNQIKGEFLAKVKKNHPVKMDEKSLLSVKTSEELGTGRPIDILKITRR